MKTLFFHLFASLIIGFMMVGCSQAQSGAINISKGDHSNPSPNEAVAYFGEGCFWHAEIVFQSLIGVRDAVSGYAGGTDAQPNYAKVCTGETGHAETVQVFYDPSKITYSTLVAAFFASQDPTELNRQGPDEGTQYRSVVFYRTDAEKQIILAEIKRLTDAHAYPNKIVTQVAPFTNFYPAEAYHQEYILRHPENGYVQQVSIPDFVHFKEVFKGNFKKD